MSVRRLVPKIASPISSLTTGLPANHRLGGSRPGVVDESWNENKPSIVQLSVPRTEDICSPQVFIINSLIYLDQRFNSQTEIGGKKWRFLETEEKLDHIAVVALRKIEKAARRSSSTGYVEVFFDGVMSKWGIVPPKDARVLELDLKGIKNLSEYFDRQQALSKDGNIYFFTGPGCCGVLFPLPVKEWGY